MSVYRAADKATLNIFIQVTLYQKAEDVQLWGRIEVPFILIKELVTSDDKNIINSVWMIDPTGEIVSQDDEQTTMSFPESHLVDC